MTVTIQSQIYIYSYICLLLIKHFGEYYLNINVSHSIEQNFSEFYPTASLAQENDADLTILLPNSESALLLNLLKALEQESKEPVQHLGIESYGLSMTSLEDVFLKITADESEHTDEPKPSARYGEQNIDVEEYDVGHMAGAAAALDSAEGTRRQIIYKIIYIYIFKNEN